jgi:flagellar basal body P-ring protein FlgI
MAARFLRQRRDGGPAAHQGEHRGTSRCVGIAELAEGSSLSDVVAGLHAPGVSPRGMIDILKTIHSARAMHADFLVQ